MLLLVTDGKSQSIRIHMKCSAGQMVYVDGTHADTRGYVKNLRLVLVMWRLSRLTSKSRFCRKIKQNRYHDF